MTPTEMRERIKHEQDLLDNYGGLVKCPELRNDFIELMKNQLIAIDTLKRIAAEPDAEATQGMYETRDLARMTLSEIGAIE